MAFRVLAPSAPFAGFAFEQEALAGLDIDLVEHAPSEAAFLAAAAGGAAAIYAKSMPVTARMIAGVPGLRAIVCPSVGVDHVDVAAASAAGVVVTNCPDTFIEEVADHAMMLLLATHRRCIEQDRMVREGRWREGRPALYRVPRLMGLTLGLLAFGRVARAVARRAAPFGLRLIAHDPHVEEVTIAAFGTEPVTFEELLERSDILSLHAPGGAGTRGLIGAAALARMKPGAILLNTGRGGVVEEAALIAALREGRIAGAGLDVLEQEPPAPDNPLLGMPNVILSPHNASASSRFDPARRRRVGRELALVLSGRWPLSCVNPAVLAGSGLARWQP